MLCFLGHFYAEAIIFFRQGAIFPRTTNPAHLLAVVLGKLAHNIIIFKQKSRLGGSSLVSQAIGGKGLIYQDIFRLAKMAGGGA